MQQYLSVGSVVTIPAGTRVTRLGSTSRRSRNTRVTVRAITTTNRGNTRITWKSAGYLAQATIK